MFKKYFILLFSILVSFIRMIFIFIFVLLFQSDKIELQLLGVDARKTFRWNLDLNAILHFRILVTFWSKLVTFWSKLVTFWLKLVTFLVFQNLQLKLVCRILFLLTVSFTSLVNLN